MLPVYVPPLLDLSVLERLRITYSIDPFSCRTTAVRSPTLSRPTSPSRLTRSQSVRTLSTSFRLIGSPLTKMWTRVLCFCSLECAGPAAPILRYHSGFELRRLVHRWQARRAQLCRLLLQYVSPSSCSNLRFTSWRVLTHFARLVLLPLCAEGEEVVAASSMQRDPIVARVSELMRLDKMLTKSEIKAGKVRLSGSERESASRRPCLRARTRVADYLHGVYAQSPLDVPLVGSA